MKTLKLKAIAFFNRVANKDPKAELTAWGAGTALLIIVVAALHCAGCVDLSQLKK